MKKTGILFLLIIICFTVDAQTVILKVDRKDETKPIEKGPNLKKFSHFYFRAGIIASKDNPGARIIYGTSVNLAFGFRKKHKVSAVYSFGYEIELQYTDYKLKQNEEKFFPDTIINLKERFDISSLAFGIYNRFNFDSKRGNYLGNFLDLGIIGEWNYSMKIIAKNKLYDDTDIKTVTGNLTYTNSLNAKIFARVGFNHLSFFASWRLMELFKKSSNYPDMPRLAAGIEIALF